MYSISTKLYKDDPGLTLTYFVTRSDLVKIACCAYTRPGYQVRVYRINGHLVLTHLDS